MKTHVLMLAVLAAVAASDVHALTYNWKAAVDGDWDDSTKWNQNSGFPDNDDVATMTVGGNYRLALTDDVSIMQLKPSCSGILTIDLGGHSMTLVGGGSVGNNRLYPNKGSAPSTPGQMAYDRAVVISNGTLNATGMTLGDMGLGNSGLANIDFSNVQLSGYVNSWSSSGRIIIRDGSVWTVTKETRIEPGLYHEVKNTRYPCLIVTGATSRVDSGSYNVIIGSWDGGLYLRDGATATFNDVNIGGSFRSTNAVASVSGSTLTANGTLRVGTDNTNPTDGGTGTIRCDDPMGRSATLVIEGARSIVTAAALEVYENTDSGMRITVPQNGFVDAGGTPRAPIQAGTLAFVARPAGAIDFGPTHVGINCYAWAQAHSEETITLVELETPNASALETLAGYVVWSDYPADVVAAGNGPTLAVSQDGMRLLLTSPAVNRSPVFALSSSAGTKVGEKTIVLNVNDYGYGMSELSVISCEFADNPDFTGSSTTNFLAGLSPVATAAPFEISYALDGSFVQHGRYWAKVRAVNEGDYGFEQTIEIAGDPIVDELSWFEAVDGNFEDVSRWKIGDAAANTFPYGEDHVKWKASSLTHYTVSFTNDAEVAYFAQYGSASHSPITLDLGGHSLTMKDRRNGTTLTLYLSGSEEGGANTNWCGATMLLRNGTVSIPPTATSASGFALGGSVFGASSKVCGTLVLEDKTSFTANIKYFMNSSRFFVLSGSEYHTISQELRMQNHTANCGNGRIMVAGAGSLLDMKTYNLYVRGENAVCEVLDGGRLVAGDLLVGGTNHLWGAGTVASDKTQIRFDNGTAAISGKIELGWESDMKCNARLDLAGTNTSVVVQGSLSIHEQLASTLAFEVPAAGYNSCPLQVKNLEFVAKPAGNADYGATKLSVSAKAWMKAHPRETLDLVTLTTANAAALEKLKSYAVLVGVNAGRYPGHEFLSVSDDGKRLVLTAPEKVGAMLIFR